jgi:hypothetical protein
MAGDVVVPEVAVPEEDMMVSSEEERERERRER